MKNKHFARNLDYNILNKDLVFRNYVSMFLNRTQQIFKYEGLPDTLPKQHLERLLQEIGCCIVIQTEDGVMAFYGYPGGLPNVYNEGSSAIVASHIQKYNGTFEIDEPFSVNIPEAKGKCVIIRNDFNMVGLLPIVEKYAILLTDLDITLRNKIVWMRTPFIPVADDDKTKKSAELFIKKIEDGELNVISSSKFSDGLKVHNPPSNSSSIKELIELKENLKASFYQELGINMNSNQKREYVSDSEINIGDPSVLPLIDEMLEQRQKGIEKINQLFGTNITVSLSSAWEVQHEVIESEVDDEPEEPEEGEKEGENDED